MMASSFLLPPGFLKIFLCKLDHVTAQKISFLLGISSANVTKPQETADMVTFTEEILNGKLHFLCSVSCICIISKKKRSKRKQAIFFGLFEVKEWEKNR